MGKDGGGWGDADTEALMDKFLGRSPLSDETNYWNKGGLAGVLGMDPWYKTDPIEMASNFVNPVPAMGLAGMFAGKAAKTANTTALAKARKMEKSGINKDAIWRETGWGRGADGEWRFEIDDSGAKLTQQGDKDAMSGSLADALSHPEIYQAYPDAGGIFTKLEPRSLPSRGQYQPPEPRGHMGLFDLDEQIDIHGANRQSALHHESQHAIQGREGFAQGGSAMMEYGGKVDDAILALREKISSVAKSIIGAPKEKAATLHLELGRLRKLESRLTDQAAFDKYHRRAGEVEARNVQTRMDWDAAKRRETPPWHTEDVPRDEQIVRRGLGNTKKK